MILTETELKNKKYKFISKNDDILFSDKLTKTHQEDFNFYSTDIKPGQFFLYEKMEPIYSTDSKSRNMHIYYPKLAIYLDRYVVDQALEIEYKDVRRN